MTERVSRLGVSLSLAHTTWFPIAAIKSDAREAVKALRDVTEHRAALGATLSALTTAGESKQHELTVQGLAQRIELIGQANSTELAQVNERNARMRAADDAALAAGQLTLSRYYDDRRRISETSTATEIAGLQRVLAERQKTPTFEIAGSLEADKRLADVTRLEDQITTIRIRGQHDRIGLEAEESQRRQANARAILTFEQLVADAQGRGVTERILAIEHQAREQARLLVQRGDVGPLERVSPAAAVAGAAAEALALASGVGQAVAHMQHLGAAAGVVAKEMADLLTDQVLYNDAQQKSQIVFQTLASGRETVQQQVRRGILTQAEGQEQLARLERSQVGDLAKSADEMERLASALHNPALLAAAQFLRVQISGLGGDLSPASEHVLSMTSRFELAAAAVKNLAVSIGGVDSGLAHAAEGALKLFEGIDAATKARDAFEKASAAGDSLKAITAAVNVAGAIGQAIGAAVSIFQTLFGPDPQELERRSIISRNTDALLQLQSKLSNTLQGPAGLLTARNVALQIGTGDERARLQRAAFLLPGSNAGNFPGSNPAERQGIELANFLLPLHLTFTDLDRIAKDYGITLRDSNNNLILPAFQQFADALKLGAQQAIQWGEGLDAQRSQAELRAKVYNVPDTPASRIQRELGLLNLAGPGIRDRFAGADTTSAAGRASIREQLKALYEATTQKGALTALDFGKLNLDQLAGIIGTTADALNELDKTTSAATASMLNVPTGFRIARAEFEAQATQGGSSLDAVVQALRAQQPDNTIGKVLDALSAAGAGTDKLGTLQNTISAVAAPFAQMKTSAGSMASLMEAVIGPAGSVTTSLEGLGRQFSALSASPGKGEPTVVQQFTGGVNITISGREKDAEQLVGEIASIMKDKALAVTGNTMDAGKMWAWIPARSPRRNPR